MKTMVRNSDLQEVVEKEAPSRQESSGLVTQPHVVDSVAVPVDESLAGRKATPTLVLSIVSAAVFSAALVFYVLLPTLRTLVSALPTSWNPAP